MLFGRRSIISVNATSVLTEEPAGAHWSLPVIPACKVDARGFLLEDLGDMMVLRPSRAA